MTFTAINGQVAFEGKPLCAFTVKRTRAEMIRRALNTDQNSPAFKVWMEAVDALIAAQTSAAEQQRKIAA